MRKIILAAFLWTSDAQAQFLLPGNDVYWTESTPSIQYIFSEDHSSAIPELRTYMEYFINRYVGSYGWTPDEQIHVIVASSYNQIANGFATPIPFLQTVHFTSGSELLDRFAEDSFLLSLASHETAHLFQLNAKSRLGTMISNILGNTLNITIFLPVPIWVFPNAVLPTFILEGNAVMNESVNQRGGRLWSGESRAGVLASIKAHKVSDKTLMNSRLDFPLGDAYTQGGYLQGFLAEKYGIEKTNHFFLHHAQRNFWPFWVNKSFHENFDASYTSLIHQYIERFQPLADAQRWTSGPVLLKSFTRPVFNHDSDKIRFVANPTGRTKNRIYEYSISSEQLASKSSGLPLGKPFYLDGELWSVSSEKVSPTALRYGLFAENLKPREGSLNKIYQDIRGGHELTIDAETSYARSALLLDGQFFDITASSAIFDDEGHVYYFRQAGEERVLYRDRQPLFKYKGFFGFPVQANSDGIYFIASTQSGSSFFRWSANTLERLLEADNVIDARLTKAGEALVASVTDSSYLISTEKIISRTESPAWFDWKFETTPLPQVPSESTPPERHEYSPLSQLRFSAANFFFGGGGGGINATFTDPMWWQVLNVGYQQVGKDIGTQFQFSNHRRRLGWSVVSSYVRDQIKSSHRAPKDREYAYGAILLDYDLFRWRRFSSDFSVGPRWTWDDLLPKQDRQMYGGQATWSFNFTRVDFPLAYQPIYYANLNLNHQTEYSTQSSKKRDSTNSAALSGGIDLFRETYLDAQVSWAKSELDSIKIRYFKAPRVNGLEIPLLLSDGQASEVREWSVSLKQAINISYYLTRFPVSLRRLAPVIALQDTWTRENRGDRVPHWRQQLQMGLESELLLLNVMPVRFFGAINTINIGGKNATGAEAGLLFKKSF